MLHGEKRTSQIVGVDLGRYLMVPGHFFGASQLLTLHQNSKIGSFESIRLVKVQTLRLGDLNPLLGNIRIVEKKCDVQVRKNADPLEYA